MSNNVVPVEQAARELGLAPQGVREYMKRGLIDIGDVLPAIRGKGYRYKIYRAKLDKHIGKDGDLNENHIESD